MAEFIIRFLRALKLSLNNNLIWLGLWIVGFIGCSIQVAMITEKYTEYPTNARIHIKQEQTAFPPAVAMCFKVSEYPNHTVEQLFSLIRPEKQAISSLRYWNEDETLYDTATDPKDISSLIEIKKFVKLSFVCYSIKRKIEDRIDYNDLTDNFERPMFYRMKFHKLHDLDVRYNYWYMFQNRSKFYGTSTAYAETDSRYTWITLSYRRYRENLLPPPYTTWCYNYSKDRGVEDSGHCFQMCFLNETRRLKMYPFDLMIDGSYDLKLKRFTPALFNQTALRQEVMSARKRCRYECRFDDCRREIFVPIIVSVNRDNKFTIDLYVSNEPTIKMFTVPALSLINYVTYVLSCLSFWLSFSPVALVSYKCPYNFDDKKSRNKIKKRGPNFQRISPETLNYFQTCHAKWNK